ncbi:hypothetical protein [Psychroserpens algicola]|uniref:Uncharacterized protein n=1 Tax=Psychroserpens algicola TaxID=1719034 RepID=A0ABT0H877_9FLAO|nr:hypothetical protein [Psychroserpens algicola]MCK8480055.1 hypothetical protein [Psychroserpens algicola]
MKRILLFVCTLLFAFSCSNDDSTSPETPEANFYALTVGNSWVYKNYRYNINTQLYEDTGVIDSVSIVSTENISGETYFKFRRLTTGNEDGITFCNPNGEHFEYLREDNGNLVRSDGNVKFTNNDFSLRVLSQNVWGIIVEQLIEGESTMNVEAGSFTCVNSERYALLSPNNDPSPGLDRFYYSDGFGLIYDTSSYVSNDIPSIIRRLDTYVIQ